MTHPLPPRFWPAPAEDRLEQRRLAGAVRPDERDVLAALDRERRVVQQRPAGNRDLQVFGLEHGAAAARRIDEPEAEPARSARQQGDLVGRAGALLLQAPDLPELRLCLLRLRLLVAEARDEAFEPRDVLLETCGLLLRCGQPHRALAPPFVPRAGEIRRASRFELEHRGRRRLEEPAVVRDEDNPGVQGRQLVLQPFERRDVEVVRRLVEQQQIGIAAERARERGARQLAAGEGVEGTVQIRVAETQPTDDRPDAFAPVVAARVLEARLRLGVAPQRRRPVVAGGHRLLETAQLALRLDEVGGAREHVVAQREAELQRRPLVVQRDPRSLLERKLAAVQLGLAGEEPEQRRLAGAVRAGQGNAVAPLHFERDAVEEQAPGELLAEVRCDDDCHGNSLEASPSIR